MSEGALNMGDEEHAVVGEPVSHPHQAAVVGEPVPLANGLQKGQQPTPSSSSDDLSTTNGVLEETSEPPSESRDAPSSVDSTVEIPSPSSAPSSAEEHSTSQDASAEEGTHESASENHLPPECATDALDAPSQEAFDSTSEAKPDTDIPADVQISHIADIPSVPSIPWSEYSTENRSSTLEEGSTETDVKASVEDVAMEEPVAADRLTECAAVPGEAVEASVQDEDASTADSAEPTIELNARSRVTREEPTTENEEKKLSADLSEEIKDSEHIEVNTAKPQRVDVATQESNAGTSNVEETDVGSAGACDSGPDPVSTRDAKVQEDDTIEGNSAKPAILSSDVKHVVSREAAQLEVAPNVTASAEEDEDEAAPDAVDSTEVSSSEVEQLKSSEPEVISNEKVFSKDGEGQAAPQGQIDDNISVKVYPTESSGTRAISVEECTDGTAFGENGFQHPQDGIPLEREQGLTKEDDTESAEGKEKPTSGLKLPLIFATLAIAVVGVAVTSISRARH